jgi:8-oxo-dGTP pyrophosphatase MutT (NUDIX family)
MHRLDDEKILEHRVPLQENQESSESVRPGRFGFAGSGRGRFRFLRTPSRSSAPWRPVRGPQGLSTVEGGSSLQRGIAACEIAAKLTYGFGVHKRRSAALAQGAAVLMLDAMDDAILSLRKALADYRDAHASARATATEFVRFLESAQDVFKRTHSMGHFTGSAWLVDRSGERVLLTHHRKLNAWLQLGGHADGDADLSRVALREAEEESGLADLVVEPAIFDIDRHRIPARANEPEHWHYDVRYIVRATKGETFVVGEESHDLAWRRIADLVGDESIDASVRRMARKWLARGA